ncbi:helix-turn-helix transcriptional regulator [Pseudomonas sp. JAI120]|uniref:helix-turn-helix transcriptional regulator n=1 Tax=Pseudomonas sp. JAI120 TaxID=2723063 RepID=UPI0030DB573F
MTKEGPTTDRILIGSKEIMQMLGIGRTTLHRIRNKDSTFPTPIKDGPHRQAHAYFVKAEVEAWIKLKADNRGAPTTVDVQRC